VDAVAVLGEDVAEERQYLCVYNSHALILEWLI